ncbi:restriction endonuclease subunit S [Glaciecola sp. 2405UD65-10]|uniref:restriction endonuclease subunit S n=1 Tax=Glaciecola sp. 2405UD65-10 TaxID=3397244 RepID=UPI003B5CDAF0
MTTPNSNSLGGGNPQKLITDHIDIWTSTIKTKPSSGRGSSKKLDLHGIKKLRELILELAVRGKLVPQDINDEPASELLKKLFSKKEMLIKEGRVKKQKPSPSNINKENLFELPSSWQWQYIGNLAIQITDGVHHRPNYIDSGVPFISVKDIDGKTVSFSDCRFISKEQHLEINKRCNPDTGDILICRIGTLGRATIVDTERPFSLFVSVGLIKFIQEYYTPRFTHLVLNSPLLLKQYNEIKAGGSHTNKLNLGDIPKLVMPVAPLKEQHRIVAKVTELMTLCDQLESRTEASIYAHKILVETLLATLTNAKDADELNDSWQRISKHFDVLFTTQDSIDQLKQTILQLAVMGKLVKQDPNDEPASKLLERIAAEKEQLIKDKKIKKQKALAPITEEEKPFALPRGWCLSRLDDICFGITSGSTPPKDKFNETTGVPYLKVYNIKDQSIAFDYRPQFIDVQHHKDKLTRSILYPGDVVMNIVGPPLGKIAIIPDDYPEWNCNQAIVFFRPIEVSLNRYIYTYLTSGIFLDSMELIGTAGQDNISVTKSRGIIFPMPPLAEQHRIVAKVYELMAICDSLSKRLKETQYTQLHLTDAIADRALL